MQNLARLLSSIGCKFEVEAFKAFHPSKDNCSDRDGFVNIASEKLIRGVSFKLWEVDSTDIEYQYEEGHTLSLYLSGGQTTYRTDKPNLKGQPGKLCLMPKDHLSRWRSSNTIRIAHLYLPDHIIRQDAERCLDIDARFAELKDITYQEDRFLSQAMLSLINALKHGSQIDPLFAEEALNAVSASLLAHYRQSNQREEALTKGLSS